MLNRYIITFFIKAELKNGFRTEYGRISKLFFNNCVNYAASGPL